MTDTHVNINEFIDDLLHVQDVKNNKLLNVYAGDARSTYIIQRGEYENFSKYVLDIIQRRIGKPANVALKQSSLAGEQEQIVGLNINALDWTDATGKKDANYLQKTFISGVYKDLAQKGTNPLYLTVGGIEWMVSDGKDGLKKVMSPVLIFPIRLVRADAGNTPVYIEFINDDIYVNPCLIAKLKQVYGEEFVEEFPHPNKEVKDLSLYVSLDDLGDGIEFFSRLQAFVNEATAAAARYGNNTVFSLDKDFVSILNYNHDEICMYYDIQRNRDKIYDNKLIADIFNARKDGVVETERELTIIPQFIMPKDSTQETIIRKVLGGQSMIIKGPPGTGKTLTITNMLASLLAENKKVLLCSKKLGALAEINAKLPEELRKFTMLLDCESEAEAAKLNPSEVRSDFIALLNAKKTFTPNDSISNELSVARRSMYDSISFLNEYKDIAFQQKDILGKNYYEALDMLCDKNIEPIPFVAAEEAYSLNLDTFNKLMKSVEDIGNAFKKVTKKAPFYKCPWIPVGRTLTGIDEPKALAGYAEIIGAIEGLQASVRDPFEKQNVAIEKMDISTLYQIASSGITAEYMERYLQAEPKANRIMRIQQLLDEYCILEGVATNVSVTDEKALEEVVFPVDHKLFDEGLTKSDFDVLYENWALLGEMKKSASGVVLKYLQDLEKLLLDKREAKDGFHTIIDTAITEEGLKNVEASVEPLRKYFDTPAEKPNLLDFKAKSCVKKLVGLGYGKELSFEQIVTAVNLYDKMHALDLAAEEVKTKISSMLKTKLTSAQINAIVIALRRALACEKSFEDYFTSFAAFAESVHISAKAVTADGEYTIGEMLLAIKRHQTAKKLLEAVLAVDESTELKTAVAKAKTILAADAIVTKELLGSIKKLIPERLQALEQTVEWVEVKEAIERLLALLKAFRRNSFANYYTVSAARLTFADLQILVETATDRNILGAADTYMDLLQLPHALPLAKFFMPFERGSVDSKEEIEEIFKHTIYRLATEYKLSRMGDMRNGLGERVSRAFDEFTEAETKEQALTIKNIERMCMSRINAKDPSFSFLNSSKSTGETLRLLFKKNADGIIKLKRCFLLSPSTASILLSQPAFYDFDVVICDEASQLEPIAMLPLLVRARQIVLVGDEWQMPPIKRGVARLEKRIDEGDGDYTILSPDISALSLALKNRALPTAELGCHYRSKAESLISFSQERFYPYMRTFPAVVPKGDGVGLYDVYVEDGRCDGGQNMAEAKEVIRLMKDHFDKYYDPQTQTLAESLGIVGFGQDQVDLINKLLNEQEKEFSKKISVAKRNFEDEVKEKLFFIKPIDKVQGQEIEHLILSLTYGKDKNGKIVNKFGELNRGNESDKLGQCIFNVAVTRAKSSVTVVRSIQSYDITTPSVLYIAEYLKQVERFREGGRAQFVGESPNEVHGFLKEVSQLLIRQGVAAERIVLNYGATKGSVKIPLVVLDKTLTRGQFALWCEVPTNNTYDYLDYNVKYYEILKSRGWKFERVFLHDWFYNNQVEEQRLVDAIKKKIDL